MDIKVIDPKDADIGTAAELMTSMVEISAPNKPPISAVCLFLAINPKTNEEGLVALQLPTGDFAPLVISNQNTAIDKLQKLLQPLVDKHGYKIQMVSFGDRKLLGEILPNGGSASKS